MCSLARRRLFGQALSTVPVCSFESAALLAEQIGPAWIGHRTPGAQAYIVPRRAEECIVGTLSTSAQVVLPTVHTAGTALLHAVTDRRHMRVLIVATSEARLADSKTPTGAWAEEIAVPYYMFRQKGYVVELASPRGQAIPLDPRSVTPEVQHRCPDVRRFLADGEAMSALQSSTSIVFARHAMYDAIYVAGGHGIMWDGAVNDELKKLLEAALANAGVVATCGHGAVALLDVKDQSTGDYFVKNKEVTAPTRLDEQAAGVMDFVPFQLPEELKKRGATFSHADTLDAPWAVRSGQLVTGQNCNAAKKVAELVVEYETFGVRVTP